MSGWVIDTIGTLLIAAGFGVLVAAAIALGRWR
jgi:hypothetical protein